MGFAYPSLILAKLNPKPIHYTINLSPQTFDWYIGKPEV